jgi:hypothetical protein
MESFVPLVETIGDEPAKHAMLLVDAVEERASMTRLRGSSPGKLWGVRGGLHILTFTQRAAFSRCASVWRRSVPSRVQLRRDPALDERDSAYVFPPSLSTGGNALGLYDGHAILSVCLNDSMLTKPLAIVLSAGVRFGVGVYSSVTLVGGRC